MKPVLKISELTNLHDARYCAAMGLFLQAFSLEKGHNKKVGIETLKEIKPWLSGPDIIGEYGYETPDEIKSDLEAVALDHVSVPVDYPADLAKEIPTKLIFRSAESLTSGSAELQSALKIGKDFPEALLELSLDGLDPDLWEVLASSGLLERSLLKFSNPDPIWILLQKQGLQPYGFSLGAYVEEADGMLDYEVCDDLVEKFNELAPQV